MKPERKSAVRVLLVALPLGMAVWFRWGLPMATGFWVGFSVWVVAAEGLILGLCPEIRRALVQETRANVLLKAIGGLLAAGLLYGLFWSGRWILLRIYPATGRDLAGIYFIRSGLPEWVIVLLLVGLIGPGEELIWRVFIQGELVARVGGWRGWLAGALIYALVHTGSGNPVLIVAALVAGLFWGALYLRYRSFWLNAVSHTAWDVAVFVLAPF